MRHLIVKLAVSVVVTMPFAVIAQSDRDHGGVAGAGSTSSQESLASMGSTNLLGDLAALRRLFSDPHFNRISEMNIDVADFGSFDPIPPEMFKVMDQARIFGLADGKPVMSAKAPSSQDLPSEGGARLADSRGSLPRDAFDTSVRNAELRQLFADPHFNQISDMNIVVEDFSRFEPIPLRMLLAMDQARVLGFGDGKPASMVDRLTAELQAAPPAAGLKFDQSRNDSQSAFVDWVDGSGASGK